MTISTRKAKRIRNGIKQGQVIAGYVTALFIARSQDGIVIVANLAQGAAVNLAKQRKLEQTAGIRTRDKALSKWREK